MASDTRVTGACFAASAAVSLWAVRDSNRLLDIPGLVLLAVGYIFLSALAAFAVFVLLRRRRFGCLRHTFFSCLAPAALLPGTALLLSRHSVWGVVPAAAIVWIIVSGTRAHRAAAGADVRHMSPLRRLPAVSCN